MSKQQFMIDVCNIGDSKSLCTHKERMVFYYYKNKALHKKIIYQCGTVGKCDSKKHAIMTIDDEIE